MHIKTGTSSFTSLGLCPGGLSPGGPGKVRIAQEGKGLVHLHSCIEYM